MQFTDALMVAGAGIVVVFSGLLITNLLISSLPLIIKLRSLFTRSEDSVASEGMRAEKSSEKKTLAQATPEVIAVISTVLEIERRLNFSQKVSRYTFKDRKISRTGLVR